MTLTTEHKFEIDKMKKELNAIKAKYLAQKKKDSKAIHQSGKENVPSVVVCSNRFHGGGFKLTTPLTKSSGPLIAVNK